MTARWVSFGYNEGQVSESCYDTHLSAPSLLTLKHKTLGKSDIPSFCLSCVRTACLHVLAPAFQCSNSDATVRSQQPRSMRDKLDSTLSRISEMMCFNFPKRIKRNVFNTRNTRVDLFHRQKISASGRLLDPCKISRADLNTPLDSKIS